MAKSLDRVVWDACAFIAYIQQEVRVEGRASLCSSVLRHAQRGNIEIVTSTLALAEVRKAGIHTDWDTVDKVAGFLDQPFIHAVPLDFSIGREARKLGLTFDLGPQDAVYLATAAVLDVPVLHTFDRGLLDVTMQAMTRQGRPIRICWPEPVELPATPLLDDPRYGQWA